MPSFRSKNLGWKCQRPEPLSPHREASSDQPAPRQGCTPLQDRGAGTGGSNCALPSCCRMAVLVVTHCPPSASRSGPERSTWHALRSMHQVQAPLPSPPLLSLSLKEQHQVWAQSSFWKIKVENSKSTPVLYKLQGLLSLFEILFYFT